MMTSTMAMRVTFRMTGRPLPFQATAQTRTGQILAVVLAHMEKGGGFQTATKRTFTDQETALPVLQEVKVEDM